MSLYALTIFAIRNATQSLTITRFTILQLVQTLHRRKHACMDEDIIAIMTHSYIQDTWVIRTDREIPRGHTIQWKHRCEQPRGGQSSEILATVIDSTGSSSFDLYALNVSTRKHNFWFKVPKIHRFQRSKFSIITKWQFLQADNLDILQSQCKTLNVHTMVKFFFLPRRTDIRIKIDFWFAEIFETKIPLLSSWQIIISCLVYVKT